MYELFQSFCRQGPKLQVNAPDKRTGKTYSNIYFNTRALLCFRELFDLFYQDGRKVVPSNIYELLTPLGLAYLLCDDGSYHKSRKIVRISTNSFSFDEVQLLVSVLTGKFGLKSTINKDKGGFRIRISRESLPVLQALLKDIMPPMMKHKIGLEN